ncbi:MAG: sugar-binding domain-containing protein [Bacteroidota bacterium]
MKKHLFSFLLCLACSGIYAQDHQRINLEGEWKFRIDSLDRGIEAHWYTRVLEGSIKLPGSMAENGLGDDVTLSTPWTGSIIDSAYYTEDRYEKYRQPGNFKIPFWLKPVKYYAGPAWYQKEFTIPEAWTGQGVILHLERCHWESTVFVNEHKAGSRNSLSAPHEYDLTPYLETGTNTLSIRIDNRMIVPVGINSHSISEHTQSNWNGIIGELYLEAVPAIRIKDIQIFPDIHAGKARVRFGIEDSSGKNFTEQDFVGKAVMKASSFNTDSQHNGPVYETELKLTGTNSFVELEYPIGSDALLWDEFSPALYRMEIELHGADGTVLDSQTEVFGMREFAAKGTRFEVNGQSIFLRGTLECCIFPLTGYPPADEAGWEHVMKRCMDHGLNHLRFHSWCPPEAAFTVADKLGIYLQVECGSWANQGSTIGDGGPLDPYIYEEADRIIEAYGNHPSFCMLAYGNEPAGQLMNDYLIALMDSWRSRDMRRVYTAGAGWPLLPENDYHNGPQPRIQHWGAGLHSIINAAPAQTGYDFREVISSYDIPFVSHEIGQWCVYPDFKEMEKYTGVLKPTNFEIFQESLEENHMGDQAEDFLMASGKLQALCYKAEIEAALRTPGFAGFQLLQLHDFPGQGTALVGVLDPFFNSKGYISPEEFRQFCEKTVPLARMNKQVYQNNETFTADIEISHFNSTPLRNCKVLCQIHSSSGELIYEKKLEKEDVPVDNAIPLGSLEYDLKEITSAEKLTLTVCVEGTPYSNAWDLWVYPQSLKPQKEKVRITDKLDRKARSVLDKGGSVLLLTHGQVNQDHGAEVEIGFSSIFWNTSWTRGQAPHTLGILCNPKHPVFEEFPTEYHSNWQWWDPVNHSQAMILDDFPAEVRPLIQPIDTWFENRRLGLLFEAKTGNGKLMVCSIDLQEELSERPVSRQLLYSILTYMNSPDFNPLHEVAPDRILEIL